MPGSLAERLSSRNILALTLACAGCLGGSARLPLPTPFSPVGGATPVPGNGVGLGTELGNSLRGPELTHGEVRAASIGVGAADVLSIWWGSPQTQDQVEFGVAHVGVQQIRLKAVFAKPHDGRMAIAVYAANSWGSRAVFGDTLLPGPPLVYRPDTLQRDRVSSWDFAVPAELLIGRRYAASRPSVFFGPRVMYIGYDDRVHADGSFKMLVPGGVGGVHISTWGVEFFLEGTLAYISRRTYQGMSMGGGLAAFPAIAVVAHLGSPYPWRLRLRQPPRRSR